MQTMPEMTIARGGRAASMGMFLALGGGLALYQMTSLVLGPGPSRQVSISLNIPAVDVEDFSQSSLANVDLVLGVLANPSKPAMASPARTHTTATTVVHRGPAAAPAVLPASTVISPTAEPTPAPLRQPVHPSPRPTPPTQPGPSSND